MEAIMKNAMSAVLAYTTHYGMAKIYNHVCVPDGIWGYIYGFASTGSPVCQMGIQILSSTQISYSTIITYGIMRTILDIVAPGNPVAK